MKNLAILGGRIIDPSQEMDQIGNLIIRQGKVWLLGQATLNEDYPKIYTSGMMVVPGFIDLHSHLREPGFEEQETIASGTEAAARGGFTTICCMPNTNPPIDNPGMVEYVKRRAGECGKARVLPISCITQGQEGKKLVEMVGLARAGTVAFSDDGRPVQSSEVMRHALEYSLLTGLPLIDHCEDIELTHGAAVNEGRVAQMLGLRGAPSEAEEVMVFRDIALAKLTRGRVHIAHVSTKGALNLIRRAKEEGVGVTCEVTPHHLLLTEAEVGNYNTKAKINPPLRTEEDRRQLVGGLSEGIIDAIATDHSPRSYEEKACEFDLASFGISGLETALPTLLKLTEEGIELKTLIEKLTMGPVGVLKRGQEAPLFLPSPLPPGIGTLKVGAPADVTVFDPQKEWVVNPAEFSSKGKNTPWEGKTVKGKVMLTIVEGKIIYIDPSLKVEG
jgi:dihydroorotase